MRKKQPSSTGETTHGTFGSMANGSTRGGGIRLWYEGNSSRFKIVGAAPARILLLCAPAGFERFHSGVR